MALVPGTRLGPYEVVAAIGAGGMGEVYRAHDTRLDRTVAIKVLPDSVADNPERLARFEREARTLAALNHTNVAQIYGIEEHALAMEFVEGEDLSARIARGALPTDEALDVARQIADALDAAHSLGIVHRDLKPSNIRIREDGTVKVLDFGLAKALAPPVELAGLTSAPTVTSPALTGLGVILGTAVYMAPEQAKGRAVDRRADIWAFGVVVYEMVTGRRPFDGETISEVLAAVIKSEPDWSPVPARLRRLLESCLEKDPKRRLRDIGDWTRQMEEPRALGRPSRSWLAWSVAAVLLLATGVLAVVHFQEKAPVAETVQFQIPPPEGHSFLFNFAVAPDGRRVAFIARDEKGTARLWVRDFGALESRPIAGTEGARTVTWKPDGREIAFAVNAVLNKVAVEGGPVVRLCEMPSAAGLASGVWSPSGVILFGGTTGGVMRSVPESGGAATPVTSLDSTRRDLAHGIPSLLPDGRHFIYLRVSAIVGQSGVFIGSLDKKPEDQDRVPILTSEGGARYSEMGAQGGRLLFLRQGTLMAQPFDARRLVLTGDPVPVAERVGNTGASGFFSVTPLALAYRTGTVAGAGPESRLAWVDREGKTIQVLTAARPFGAIELAPDGRRASVSIQPNLNVDVWLADLDRSGGLTRLTTNPMADRGSVWSPDGTRIVFYSNRNGRNDLFLKPVDGTGQEELLLKSDLDEVPTSWSRDGRFLLYQTTSPGRANDLWVLPMQGERTPRPILQTEFNEGSGRFSPDGRWIAYQSNMSGRPEIYVRSFDLASLVSPIGALTRVSTDGGTAPRWRRDGTELFYEAPDGSLMAVDVSTEATFRLGAARRLFPLDPDALWDPAPDGKRFLVAMPTAERGLTPITVVLNWAGVVK